MHIIDYEEYPNKFVLVLVFNTRELKKRGEQHWNFTIHADICFLDTNTIFKDTRWSFKKDEVVSDELLKKVEKLEEG